MCLASSFIIATPPVTAGMNQTVASPYLTATSKSKSGTKQGITSSRSLMKLALVFPLSTHAAAPKKTPSTHPLPKLGKSPYHVPMARTNRNKK